MFLCLVAVFKNEEEILEEWLNHYIKQGVDHFFLIDNNSCDNYKDIINKYPKDLITAKIDNRKGIQTILYNELYLENVKNYDWTILVDLDEFIYARNGFIKISDYLKTVPENCSQIKIPWKMFGSSGYDTLEKKQPDSVIKNFVYRVNYDIHTGFVRYDKNKNKEIFCKCIFKNKYLKSIDIHFSHVSEGNFMTSNNFNIEIGNKKSQINEDILKNSCLHINHYPIQSLDRFMRIKATRGNCDNNKTNPRNEQYFRNYDMNHIYDDELKLINSQ